jgi:hypothetical protein
MGGRCHEYVPLYQSSQSLTAVAFETDQFSGKVERATIEEEGVSVWCGRPQPQGPLISVCGVSMYVYFTGGSLPLSSPQGITHCTIGRHNCVPDQIRF